MLQLCGGVILDHLIDFVKNISGKRVIYGVSFCSWLDCLLKAKHVLDPCQLRIW